MQVALVSFFLNLVIRDVFLLTAIIIKLPGKILRLQVLDRLIDLACTYTAFLRAIGLVLIVALITLRHVLVSSLDLLDFELSIPLFLAGFAEL